MGGATREVVEGERGGACKKTPPSPLPTLGRKHQPLAAPRLSTAARSPAPDAGHRRLAALTPCIASPAAVPAAPSAAL